MNNFELIKFAYEFYSQPNVIDRLLMTALLDGTRVAELSVVNSFRTVASNILRLEMSSQHLNQQQVQIIYRVVEDATLSHELVALKGKLVGADEKSAIKLLQDHVYIMDALNKYINSILDAK